MDIAHSLHSEVTSISFSFLSSDDIKAISVKKIDNPVLLDNLNLPNRGGLYDPQLGPMSSRDMCVMSILRFVDPLGGLSPADLNSCETCNLSYFTCPGHYGHIELPMPLYHPLFMNQCYHLLKGVCLFCHRFKMPELLVSVCSCSGLSPSSTYQSLDSHACLSYDNTSRVSDYWMPVYSNNPILYQLLSPPPDPGKMRDQATRVLVPAPVAESMADG
jgi:DNA-directed RNA polymerase beta' subunit